MPARDLDDAIEEIRSGALPERRVAERVAALNQQIKGRGDEQELNHRLRLAVKEAQKRETTRFRRELAAHRDTAEEVDELDLLGAANQRLHAVYERQSKSLELVSAASEALASVQRQYSTVHSNLSVTNKIINQLWDKQRSDDFLIRGAVGYLLAVAAFVVASRVFGVFYWATFFGY
eukprot:TRINITY_DN13260_c0_g1_i1.p2 TRINITY_DN13260_c0_g1~~TRINITY_DN13260_c0_g1_i1.p2  ORF type:complete len:177 (+),score=85.51 TRINITY_DN13260_c0_g1_i1:120-650(+)